MAMSRIVVSFGGSEQWDITGEKEAMHEQYRGLLAVLGLPGGVEHPFFELTGFRNLADRKAEQMVIRLDQINGVDIQET